MMNESVNLCKNLNAVSSTQGAILAQHIWTLYGHVWLYKQWLSIYLSIYVCVYVFMYVRTYLLEETSSRTCSRHCEIYSKYQVLI